MANLTAVLRKTIDGLPNATPQVRGKVYEKARAAIVRQIEAANPPLDPGVIEARRRALEDAIAETESFYADPPAETAEVPPPVEAVALKPIPSEPAAPPSAESGTPPATESVPPPPLFAREPAVEAGESVAEGPKTNSAWKPRRVTPPPPGAESRPGEGAARADGDTFPIASTPVPETAPVGELEPSEGSLLVANGPEASRAGSRPRTAARRSRVPIVASLAVLALVGAASGAGYVYRDELRTLLADIQGRIAATPATPTPAVVETTDVGEPADTAALETPTPAATPPKGPPVDSAAPAGTETPAAPATDNTSAHPRQFTQRLLPDGTEVDDGAGTPSRNAFEEGTDVATASINVPPPETPAAPAADAATGAAETAAVEPKPDPGPIPVAQKAVFYEERSGTVAGSQRGGNVVWSVVNEPPAEGQPPEPAIRAVADVPEENLKMTMTIRRNADSTLPASHVIELQFDVPKDFPGGTIENVQRLALKPTEQARGEPLIGVAGKISDGFFIIALNDLQQAIQSNLNLMGTEQWIDIPLAYSTGQRALMSIEKGIPGERVFKQAMDAWAAKT